MKLIISLIFVLSSTNMLQGQQLEDFFYKNKFPVNDSLSTMGKNMADSAIKNNPEYAFAYFMRGYYKKQLPEIKEKYFFDGEEIAILEVDTIAITADFNKSILLDDKLAEAYIERAFWNRFKEPNTSIKDFDIAIKLLPDSLKVEPLFWQATIFEENEYYQEAIGSYERSHSYGLEDWKYFGNIANVYRKMGDFEKAVQNYTQSIAINPKAMLAFKFRGFCYFKLEMYQKPCLTWKKRQVSLTMKIHI